MTSGGRQVAETTTSSTDVGQIDRTGELQLVVDLTGTDPQLELDFRPRLTPEARLLNAPRWKLAVKRVIDLLGATLALVLLAPIFLISAAAVGLTSKGPILFSQRRTGEHGRTFSLHKFRSMQCDAEEERETLNHLNESDGPVFKIRDDPRLTSVGWFIRRTSIDELPQLWNVLRGDMSLVGPRPPIPDEVEEYSEWESQRLTVKPGITGLWQVSGRAELDFETWVRMDIEYIEEWSLWLDIKLLAKTIPAVLSGRGAY